MSIFLKATEQINNGIAPSFPENVSLLELIHFYQTINDPEKEKSFLLGIESHFSSKDIPAEMIGFENFFSLAQAFDRNKNLINRFFDAVLGIYSLASLAKFDQIADEKTGVNTIEKMRVKGSFDYSHTQCHYSILLDVFNYLRPKDNQVLIDIGSGFGRVGHFLGICFPTTKYKGYELIERRVQCSTEVATKNKLTNIEFLTQDLLASDFVIPGGDYYFFYDPLDLDGLKNFTDKMHKQQLINQSKFRVVALSGYDENIIDFFKGLDWLKQIKVLKDDYFKQLGIIFETVNY